jgi:hypothetical protein
MLPRIPGWRCRYFMVLDPGVLIPRVDAANTRSIFIKDCLSVSDKGEETCCAACPTKEGEGRVVKNPNFT